jgi:peptide/nickel transport system substrate-binding protein
MSTKRRWTWLLSALALFAGFSLMVAAYGVAANRTKAAPKHSQAFGTLKAVLDTIDYLDPQQAYTGQSWWAMWNVWETLLTYKHVDGPAGYKLVPGLAQSLPQISANGKLYKFKLRAGLKYSNGARIKASDFEFAIKRGFLATGQGVGFYTDIAGAKAYSAHPTANGDISGITANNAKRTITIRMAKPRGDFLTILALIFAAPVPAGTTPAIHNGNIPASGPYRIVGYDPNRGFTMLRNKYFKPTQYIPRGNPNRVEVSLIGDANTATQRVISGSADYTNAAIPPDRIASVRGRGHLLLRKTANTYYFWMNVNVAPFNKLKVRQAVNYAIDRKAVLNQSGYLAGKRTDQILPPGMAGFRDADLYPLKAPNFTFAKKLASGNTKDGKLVYYTSNTAASAAVAQIVQFDLKQIGLDVEVKPFARAVQIQKEGTRGEPFDITSEGWIADYADPFDFINVLLSGDSLHDSNNNNVAYFNDPAYNKKMSAAAKLSGAGRYSTYGALDVDISKNAAPWAAYRNFNSRILLSKRVGCFTYNAIYSMDLAAACIK